MPGVPTVSRCQRCKRRKIKCDEKWPNCGHCIRAKVPCSGPLTDRKFVPYSRALDEHGVLPSGKPGLSLGRMVLSEMHPPPMANNKSLDLTGGGQFGRQRLSYEKLVKNPTTVADRVASRLVGFLSHQDASWNFLTTAGYMPYLPSRLGECAPLRDCVALVCSTWNNFQRNVPVEQVIDLNDYGKAVRSLRRALDNLKHITSEILAAVTILERVETVFDTGRPRFKTRHASGIQSIMVTRGPPSFDDKLGVQLALENHATLLTLWLTEGGENFFLQPPWADFMVEFYTSPKFSTSKRRDDYSIGRFFGYWPELVHKFRRLHADDNAMSRRAQMEDIRCRVENIQEQVEYIGDDISRRALSEGRITEETDEDTVIGMRYDFKNLGSFTSFASYLWIKSILNRMLYQLSSLQGQTDESLEVEYEGLCRQIWMFIPFVQKLGLIAGIMFLGPLYVAYEGGNRSERQYVLSYIAKVADYKGILPKDRIGLERLVINTARAWTGRRPLTEENK